MRPSCRCTLLAAALLMPALASAQQRGIEIGLDGGLEYSLDSRILAIAVPFQRVRAAFPSGERLAFEPALALTRISRDGDALTAFALQAGALYTFSATRANTYIRPFAGIEYVDDSFSGGAHAFDLGFGVGTRSRLADRLALRIEANVTGRFPEGGGTEKLLGATVGLSFLTR
jgi:hypothetical protein